MGAAVNSIMCDPTNWHGVAHLVSRECFLVVTEVEGGVTQPVQVQWGISSRTTFELKQSYGSREVAGLNERLQRWFLVCFRRDGAGSSPSGSAGLLRSPSHHHLSTLCCICQWPLIFKFVIALECSSTTVALPSTRIITEAVTGYEVLD
jgi:hypothetical protein